MHWSDLVASGTTLLPTPVVGGAVRCAPAAKVVVVRRVPRVMMVDCVANDEGQYDEVVDDDPQEDDEAERLPMVAADVCVLALCVVGWNRSQC
jgi:hypothetical protein